MTAPADSASQAFLTSAFSLKSLAAAVLPLMERGAGIVGHGLRRQQGVADLRLDGRRQGGAGVGRRAIWRVTSVPSGVRVNLVSAGPLGTVAAQGIPGL